MDFIDLDLEFVMSRELDENDEKDKELIEQLNDLVAKTEY